MNQSSKIGVIGLGFVGLPLSIHFANKGYIVYGFDVDSEKVTKLNNGKSYITDVSDTDINSLINQGSFKAYLPSEKIQEVTYIVVSVPTPFNEELMEPDLRAMEKAAQFIAKNLIPHQTIIFESSTFPGTLEEVVLPILSKSGLMVGKDYYLGYSPERIDPGNKNFRIEEIPKIVSGYTTVCKQKVSDFYHRVFTKIVPVSSPKVAEMAKLFENTQRLVNISLVNELNSICHKMGINFREVIQAASTKPFGFTPYFPGPGIGGHCIPVDPLYFQWKASKFGLSSELINAAYTINKKVPLEIIQLVKDKLSEIDPNNRSVLLIGLTYKKDIEDIRESPALFIFEKLVEEGMNVHYHDPLITKIILNNQTHSSLPLTTENIERSAIVLILTDHSGINWNTLLEKAAFIIDTRGVTTNLAAKED